MRAWNCCNHRNYCPTLRYGNRGSAVAFVQNLLRQRKYVLQVDGVFGRETQNAILAFQRANRLSMTGRVDAATWKTLGVTCLPNQYYPTTPSNPPNDGDKPQILPSFPDQPAYPGNEPSLDGLNYTWEEVGEFRYILTTNKARYQQGEEVQITFRKRNSTDDTITLQYPSNALFDFYISGVDGQELYRFSTNVVDTGIPHEIVMAPGEAETAQFVWNQVSNLGQWVTPQELTLWGVNQAVGVSIPLPFTII